MKIAIICEFSGTVREAFTKLGHDATSFDLLPSEQEGKHVQGDIMLLPLDYWKQFDLAICHPPCTYLAVSGARWFKDRPQEQEDALQFVKYLLDLPIKHIALENPISVISTRIRKPDQIIQPWMFGHGEKKSTCLWLKNLPLLEPTNIVDGREPKIHYMRPSPDRWKERSRTYQGIATQWLHNIQIIYNKILDKN